MMHYSENEYDLVLFTQTFHPDVDATAKLMTDLAEFLTKKGKKVLIVTPNRSYEVPEKKYPEFEIINGISVKRVKIPKLNKNKALQKIVLYYLFSIKARKTLKKTDYKVAMAILPPFFVAYNTLKVSKKKGNKFIFLLHDLHPDTLVRRKQVSSKNPVVRLLKKQNKYVFQNADKVIFVGRDQIEYVKENYNIQNERIEYIPNWSRDLKEGFIKKDAIKEKYYKPGFNILYAGNMGDAQVESLKNIFSLMNDKRVKENNIYLIMVGHGRKKDYLVKFARENNIENVLFFDYVYDFAEYQNLIHYADCCLVTLREESKGMSVPSKTYYYLSGGKPILADIPIGSEIDFALKEDGCGINLRDCEKEVAIEKLLCLKNDKKFYDELCENARKAFERKYSKDVTLEKYLGVIEKLI